MSELTDQTNESIGGGNGPTGQTDAPAVRTEERVEGEAQMGSKIFRPRGVAVISAGLAAFEGDTISTLARQTLEQMKLDPGAHTARQLNEKLVRYADVICTMSSGHRRAVIGRWPACAGRIRLIRPDGDDIVDPYGTNLQTYIECARQIQWALYQRRNELCDPTDRTEIGKSSEETPPRSESPRIRGTEPG